MTLLYLLQLLKEHLPTGGGYPPVPTHVFVGTGGLLPTIHTVRSVYFRRVRLKMNKPFDGHRSKQFPMCTKFFALSFACANKADCSERL